MYGMLPLAHNMPCVLLDHLDRSPEKQLLTGKECRIHSWILHENDYPKSDGHDRLLTHLPQCIFFKFENANWRLDGTPENGIYPIKPVKRTWFLDAYRKNPVLNVERVQLQIAPAFCITAHWSQGATFNAAIPDLKQGRGVSDIAAYVASSRVCTRHDMLIYRKFEREPYTKGPPRGPTLLLQVLRGQNIDWKEIENEYHPPKMHAMQTLSYQKRLHTKTM